VSTGATAVASAVSAAIVPRPVTPEMFGAKGDGRTNDTDAFAALSAHVNAQGGGMIVLRPVTYIVGKQVRSPGTNAPFAFTPSDILHFVGCRTAITIEGNGAILRCSPGLRYGAFDPQSGDKLPDSRENLNPKRRGVPYLGMIVVENSSGNIIINNIELDGNLQGLWIGGRYGNAGWQAGGSGIRLVANTGSEHLSRVHSHHHPQDGIILTPSINRTGLTTVEDTVCEYNGRVGLSITGGRNFMLKRCVFRDTGRAVLHSNPGAGVDIEPERFPIRDVIFADCEFSNNTGFGVVSGSAKSNRISFKACKFVGTTNWAAWPDSPSMRFSNCLFVGAINHAHGDADPRHATQFVDCTFVDDPVLSPTGRVFLGHGRLKWIAIVLNSPNVLFDRCRFRLSGDGLLPLSESKVIYSDCELSQYNPAISTPRGVYIGTNVITGNVRLDGSIIRGRTTVNGRRLS
jgi:hypothetical protein